ncbi:MAG: M1 family metallopeptidase, partial [Thermoprotei archaeon]
MEIREYTLSLDVDFDNLTFKGTCSLHIAGATGVLELDALDLEILNVTAGGAKLNFNHEGSRGKLTINGVAGDCALSVEYQGRVAEDKLTGFYKAKYSGGYVLATQFEPTGARRLFPCVDDPSFKSVYRVDVSCRKDLTVISNTQSEREEVKGDFKRVFFKPTPKMSSYLLFLGVGRFEVVQRSCDEKTLFAATVPGKSGETGFAIKEACSCLQWYSRYFSLGYPLDKLHLTALPDFAQGAMENWGAITFRESALLVGEYAGASERKRVSEVVAHEIAHQWFGNLVTMKWWDDLWLNESFATFMSFKLVNSIHPEWRIWDDFVRTNTSGAMYEDSLSSTHPVRVPVKSPEEIWEIFDQISYGKGASILRMIEAYVGEEAFRNGVRKYLVANSYGNAVGAELWENVESTSDKPVARIMEEWITKPGYPVVTVSKTPDGYLLEQHRFTLSGAKTPGKWSIPLSVIADGSNRNILMGSEELVLNLHEAPIINADATGFFRVKYDSDTYSKLLSKFESLSPSLRWVIASDLFAFLLSGEVDPALYFRMVSASTHGQDYLVTNEVLSQLNYIYSVVPDSVYVGESIKAFCRASLDAVGYHSTPGEQDNVSALRERLLTSLVRVDEAFAREAS